MSNNIKFDLLSLIEAIDKIEIYSQDFSNADNFYLGFGYFIDSSTC